MANKTEISVKKSEQETSCAPELPMLLWTFGSITAGSSREREREKKGRVSQFQISSLRHGKHTQLSLRHTTAVTILHLSGIL